MVGTRVCVHGGVESCGMGNLQEIYRKAEAYVWVLNKAGGALLC